ncbi:GntR family transcriptional regulator [Haloactinopolyspora alba]|uniref:GntR family transcriptional regulator n=1 Tax=Haloactinopolyspora alba TaxID=648780 RepID=A0A2P8DYV2_9ACTN|nr:FadR/GntR family transcriptional regulator [Haloactinopolyspora alba]PSL02408.1 GntR family transcriptional regulator [Haloactinopolyspora alba]
MVQGDEANRLTALPRPPSLHESVQTALRDYILLNGLRAGDGLPAEGALAQQLGVSRNSVREAVKGLVSLGILETRRGSGVFVKDFSLSLLIDNLPFNLLFDFSELADLLEVRRAVENDLLERAVGDMTEQTRAELQQILVEMKAKAEHGEDVLEEDRRFHRTMFADAGNAVALKLLDAFWLTMSHAVAQRAEIADPRPADTYRQHDAVYQAVLAGDVDAVRDALSEHYAPVLDRLRRTGEL